MGIEGKKALFITSHDFISAATGGEQCALRNLKLVQNIFGAENTHVCFFWNGYEQANMPQNIQLFGRTRNNLEALCAALCGCKIYLHKEEKKVLQYIEDLQPDLVFFESTLLGRLLGKLPVAAHSVVFMQNVERLYAKNKVLHEGPQFLPSYWASCYNESMAMKRADGVLVLTERDKALVQKIYSRRPDMLLPITFGDRFDVKKLKDTDTPRELLFVGSLFPPNLQGITWFIEQVMPLLQGFTLRIVGKNFEKERASLERPGVTVVGTVADLDEEYYRHTALVMPILYGDGMKVKTAEAMMYGKTIFATDEALEGYDVKGVDGIYRCNSVESFACDIKAAFEKGLPAYQPAVRELFKEKYDSDTLSVAFGQFIRKVLGE